MVQEENSIISEIQFGEASNGSAILQGSMVGANQTRAFSQGSALESKEQTLAKAKQRMKELAQVMKIPEYIVNSAYGWFTLALNKNFVKGRRSQNVRAACLYVACRRVGTHHLLIDFSMRLQISVYSLGATFLKLVRLLDIKKLEPVDASLFIQYYAENLGFGDQTSRVCKDATDLARRMTADWISSGRRPAGIAGACLLLAARMNNFQRSHAEVVAVTHVGEETIQKRLNEFKKTSSAKISILGFREAASNSKYFSSTDARPPSINKNQAIEKKVQKVLRQKTRTVKRYLELAKNGQLLTSLEVARLPISAEFPNKDSQSLVLRNDEDTNLGENEQEKERMEPQPTTTEGTKEEGDEEEEEKEEEREIEELSIINEADNISPETLAGLKVSADGQLAKEPSSRFEVKNNVSRYNDSDLDESESSEDEINEFFAPSGEVDDDDFGFDDLPDEPKDDDDDEDYMEPKIKLNRRFDGHEEKKITRSNGRLNGLRSLTSESSALSRAHGSRDLSKPKRVKSFILSQGSFETQNNESRDVVQDDLLRAILDGSGIKDEDIEKLLDELLKKNKEKQKGLKVNYSNDEKMQKTFDPNRPRNLVKNCPTTNDLLKKVRDDEELDDLDDDDEIADSKLSEEEVKAKEQMWIAINIDFLISQEKRRLKEIADVAAGNSSAQYKRRRNNTSRSRTSNFNAKHEVAIDRSMTPAENSKHMMERKSKTFSKKINYEVFDDLFLER